MQKKPMTLTTGEIKINQFYVKSISPRYHSSMSLAQVHATLPLCHWTLLLWSCMSLADTSPEYRPPVQQQQAALLATGQTPTLSHINCVFLLCVTLKILRGLFWVTAALIRSHMNGSIPFEKTIQQTIETMP